MHVRLGELLEVDPVLEKGFEWIDGKAVEKPTGAASSRVTTRLSRYLDAHVEAHGLGDVFDSEGSYRLDPKRKRIRKPDLSFVAKGRFPGGELPSGNIHLVPDLIAESVSPNDLAVELEQRIGEFFRAGTKLIWVLYPEERSVWVLRADGSAQRLTEQQELSGEDVVPGFSCPIAPLFAGIASSSDEA